MPAVQSALSTASRPPLAEWVQASVSYLADLSIKPVTYNPPRGSGLARRVGNYRMFTVRVHDGRPVAAGLSLDREAFKLVDHDTAVRDFTDEDQVERAYYAEVEALLKRETGASKIAIFDHTIRTAERAVERGLRPPVQSVHCD